jgi:hypothetical protein
MNANAVGEIHPARTMWTLFEPVHSVTYFSPEARGAYEAAGLRGFWRGYFAGRAAPLGRVGPAPVIASFFSFAPPMVARAIPQVWELAAPDRILAVRLEGAVAGLRRLAAAEAPGAIAEAAELAHTAVAALDHAGRVLGAANAALPVPEDPLGRLWRAATILREHRGDGHVAALVTAGLSGCDALRWRASLDIPRELLQPNRGWTDEQWDESAGRLVARGWLTPGGEPTPAGIDEFAQIESATDEGAAAPWRALGTSGTKRLRELLAPVAQACFAEMPEQTPIGRLRALSNR